MTWQTDLEVYRTQTRKLYTLVNNVAQGLRDLSLPLKLIDTILGSIIKGVRDNNRPLIFDPGYLMWVANTNPTAIRIWIAPDLIRSAPAEAMESLPGWQMAPSSSEDTRRVGVFQGPQGLVAIWTTFLKGTGLELGSYVGFQGDLEFMKGLNFREEVGVVRVALNYDEWLVNVETEPPRQEGSRARERSL